jgi:hypothetical protein
MPLVISQSLINVFVQLANKRGLKKKTLCFAVSMVIVLDAK